MAKEGPTFIDKHIEKVALGIALVILGYCALTWGIDTPRRVAVGKTQVKPEQVDAEILKRTQQLETTVKAVPRVLFRPQQWTGELRRWQVSPLQIAIWKTVKDKDTGEFKVIQDSLQPVSLESANLALPYAVGLVRSSRTAIKRTTPEALVAAMPKPSKPQNKYELAITPIPDGTTHRPEESIRWTAAAYYDIAALQAKWDKVMHLTVADTKQLIPHGFEVQYQKLNADGQWVDAPEMKPLFPDIRDRDGNLVDVKVPVVPEYSGENSSDVLKAMERHLRDGWATWLMQPEAASLFHGSESVSWQEVLFPWAAMEVYPADATRTTTPTAPVAPKAPTAPGVSRVTVPSRVVAPGGGMSMGDGMDEMPLRESPGDSMPAGPSAGTGEIFTRDTRKLPDFSTQLTRRRLLMWAHQAKLAFGTEYRVRYRMVFFSPLLTVDEAVEKPEMAKVQLLKSPWSDWSDPVRIDREVKYYVTGFSPVGNKAVTLTVFARKFGSWVKADFEKLTPGRMIGGEAQAQVLNPISGMKEPMLVDFRTGATLMELLTKQKYYRDGREYSDGVAVVIETADGKLIRRVKNVDSDDPEYIELRDMTKEARFRAPRPTRGTGRSPSPDYGDEEPLREPGM